MDVAHNIGKRTLGNSLSLDYIANLVKFLLAAKLREYVLSGYKTNSKDSFVLKIAGIGYFVFLYTYILCIVCIKNFLYLCSHFMSSAAKNYLSTENIGASIFIESGIGQEIYRTRSNNNRFVLAVKGCNIAAVLNARDYHSVKSEFFEFKLYFFTVKHFSNSSVCIES